MAFGPYMISEYLPLLGRWLPAAVGEGFARFLRAARVREATDAGIEEELTTATTDPYDSHPSLPERLKGLAALPADDRGPAESEPAVSLLADIDGIELRLLRVLNREWVESAALVPWDSVGSGAWPSIWERDLSEHRPLVTSFTVAGLADLPDRLAELGSGRASAREREEATVESLKVLGAALGLALRRVGVDRERGAGGRGRLHPRRGHDRAVPRGHGVTGWGSGRRRLAPSLRGPRISDLPLADPAWPAEEAEAPGGESEPSLPDRPDQPK
jgi:hypothetical protein